MYTLYHLPAKVLNQLGHGLCLNFASLRVNKENEVRLKVNVKIRAGLYNHATESGRRSW